LAGAAYPVQRRQEVSGRLVGEASFNQLLIVSAIAFLTPILSSRVPGRLLPAVVVEIICGAVLGPAGFNIIQPTEILEFLAAFGFAYLMFLSGLEVDTRILVAPGDTTRGRWRAFLTSPIGASLAVFAGTLVIGMSAVALLSLANIAPDFWLTTLILSTTSVGLVLPTLKEKGLASGPYGQTILACAFAADFITLLLIGSFAAVKREGLDWELAAVLVLPLSFLIAWRIGLSLSNVRVVSRTITELAHATSQLQVRGALALMLMFVVLAETTGSELILGSFVAGAVVSLFSPGEGDSIRIKLDAIGYGLFIPVFFINVGVDLDLGALRDSTDDLILLPTFLVVAFACKLLPAVILRLRFTAREALAAGFLLSSRLSLIIAASLIGLELGIITPGINTVIVLVAIITATLSPMAFSLLTQSRSGGLPRVVVFGAGSTGRNLASRLESNGAIVTLVDRDLEVTEGLVDRGLTVIAGEGADLAVLRRAGIDEASTFAATTSDDDANLRACRAVLAAFDVPNVVARLNDADRMEEFNHAGIKVVSVAHATSSSLVNAVLRPNLFEFLADEPEGYDIVEVPMRNVDLAEHGLSQLRLPGNTLVMLIRRDGEILVPKGSSVVKIGDVLTVAGDTDSVREAVEMLGSFGTGRPVRRRD
jgi:Kef-type K+ transport system membrane component KefB/Trk K+ transport system NAD-binding subunit